MSINRGWLYIYIPYFTHEAPSHHHPHQYARTHSPRAFYYKNCQWNTIELSAIVSNCRKITTVFWTRISWDFCIQPKTELNQTSEQRQQLQHNHAHFDKRENAFYSTHYIYGHMFFIGPLKEWNIKLALATSLVTLFRLLFIKKKKKKKKKNNTK